MPSALFLSLADVRAVLSSWKDAAQTLSYVATAAAALLAWWTYRVNSQRERAKWAVQLYEKFYEDAHYHPTRDALDCEPNRPEVEELVKEESSEFTDYLNFFELVCFLVLTKQLRKSDVDVLFDYYLKCLKSHRLVMEYINNSEKGKDRGFQQLRIFLKEIEV